MTGTMISEGVSSQDQGDSNSNTGQKHHETSDTVATLVNKLQMQLQTLDEILSMAKLSDITTPEQLDVLRLISPTVQNLANCFDGRSAASQQEGGTKRGLRRTSLESDVALLSSHSTKKLMDAASSDSSRDILKQVLEHNKPRRRHMAMFSRNESMYEEEDEFASVSKLPKELLYNMVDPKRSKGHKSSILFIAQTYGGVKVAAESIPNQKSNLRSTALQLMNSNVFVKGLIEDTNFGVIDSSGIKYLPTEFKKLKLDERKEIARMLSWENMKKWGFDAFKVDEISSHLSYEFENEMAAVATGGIDDSNKIGLEVLKRGCPIVLIGWAILASPYAQVRVNTIFVLCHSPNCTESILLFNKAGNGEKCR